LPEAAPGGLNPHSHRNGPLLPNIRRVLDTLPGNRREEFMTGLAAIVSALERTAS